MLFLTKIRLFHTDTLRENYKNVFGNEFDINYRVREEIVS